MRKIDYKSLSTTKRRSSASEAQSASSVVEYLSLIFSMQKHSSVRCYRGQDDASWDIAPSIFRGMKAGAESRMLTELMLETPADFASDKFMFDKLVRAQHYGLPTRLLDVSLNPLVALFFACADEKLRDTAGVVHAFDFIQRRVKYADSDAVSLICNLARLHDDEKDDLRKADDDDIAKLPAMQRLYQFIRVEKQYFRNEADPLDLRRYFFVYPSKANRRVIAQSGAFIVAGLLSYRNSKRAASFKIHSIEIPAKSKYGILEELDHLNINHRTMFPEIERASRYIHEKWRKKTE